MNKFKVGDKVRSKCYGEGKVVEEDNDEILVQFKKNNPCLHSASCSKNGPYKDNTCYWYGRDTNQLEILKNEYTYEDLKKCPIGTKITFEDGRILIKARNDYINDSFTDIEGFRSIMDLKGLKDSWIGGYFGKIIKIEEPAYTAVYEAEPEVLDEAEKRYLKDVIRPFRNRIKYICKSVSAFGKYEYIEVNLGNDTLVLPDFKPNTMYKGMKVDKKYALKELDL